MVARWYVFKPKNWVNFGLEMENVGIFLHMAIWNILMPSGRYILLTCGT
jgi:hypothetical protein